MAHTHRKRGFKDTRAARNAGEHRDLGENQGSLGKIVRAVCDGSTECQWAAKGGREDGQHVRDRDEWCGGIGIVAAVAKHSHI
jgi:hypothetical protein